MVMIDTNIQYVPKMSIRLFAILVDKKIVFCKFTMLLSNTCSAFGLAVRLSTVKTIFGVYN